MKRGSFAAGFLTCLLLTGVTTTAFAAGITAERSANRIFVDGQEIQIEAYAIHDNNFMQLRDIGKAVGFNVYWNAEDGSVQIESNKPYTGAAPVQMSTAKTVALPADGTRYVPSAGDVIRCNDGSDYTITDVSRWDASLFASGTLGELPAPTCDWSRFPNAELPAPDARHFLNGDTDTLLIRNLYETRRMQYTLYNLIGSDSTAWNNGIPWATVKLHIDDDAAVGNFWPWRESEITNLFRSRPISQYAVEAWDVYENGIFQHTRYLIQSL